MSDLRSKVLISGYYGFDNLGDEAILEKLCTELKGLCAAQDIYVLSANPQKTRRLYEVNAIDRQDFSEIWRHLRSAKLLVSGGGGLFQNTRSIASIIFYGLHVFLAKAAGAKVVIYAQGIGPLRGFLAEVLSQGIFRLANSVTVRDQASFRLLQSWKIQAVRTADPVWSLAASALPPAVESELEAVARLPLSERPFLAVSLRPSADFSETHLSGLADLLVRTVPEKLDILLLPLQEAQDLPLLTRFKSLLSERGRSSHLLDCKLVEKPSQWLSLFALCRGLVAMRLHALIMAIKAGVPVAGIGYDPKVSQLLTDFHKPILILNKDWNAKQWEQELLSLLPDLDREAEKGNSELIQAQSQSLKNSEMLAKILQMPSVGG